MLRHSSRSISGEPTRILRVNLGRSRQTRPTIRALWSVRGAMVTLRVTIGHWDSLGRHRAGDGPADVAPCDQGSANSGRTDTQGWHVGGLSGGSKPAGSVRRRTLRTGESFPPSVTRAPATARDAGSDTEECGHQGRILKPHSEGAVDPGENQKGAVARPHPPLTTTAILGLLLRSRVLAQTDADRTASVVMRSEVYRQRPRPA